MQMFTRLWRPLPPLLLGALAACTTQGLQTYEVLTTSDDPTEIQASMELLKDAGREGSLQQQTSAMRELRFMTRHLSPEKQQHAIPTLAYLSFTSDDGYLQDRGRSRLEAMLTTPEWDVPQKTLVATTLRDLSLGTLGHDEQDDAFQYVAGLDSDERQDVLAFQLDVFPNVSSELQAQMLDGWEALLLSSPATLEGCPADICDADIRQNLDGWRQAEADEEAELRSEYEEWHEELDELKLSLWAELEEILKEGTVTAEHQSRILDWRDKIESFQLRPASVSEFVEVATEWKISEKEDV
jgi:hypothetical protein